MLKSLHDTIRHITLHSHRIILKMKTSIENGEEDSVDCFVDSIVTASMEFKGAEVRRRTGVQFFFL